MELRKRRDDITFIINYFMKKISKRLNKPAVSISDEQLKSKLY